MPSPMHAGEKAPTDRALEEAVETLPREKRPLARLVVRRDLRLIAHAMSEGRELRWLLLLGALAEVLHRHLEEVAKLHERGEIALITADERTSVSVCHALPEEMRRAISQSPAGRRWCDAWDASTMRMAVRLQVFLTAPLLLNFSADLGFHLEPGSFERGVSCD